MITRESSKRTYMELSVITLLEIHAVRTLEQGFE